MRKVSAAISRSIQTISPPVVASHWFINDDVSLLIVASKPATFRWLNTGCISLRCLAHSGPSLVTRPLPITPDITR